MSIKKELPRTVQCAKCPWKVSTNPRDIPNGYCETKHRALESTIARDLSINRKQPAMACHHSTGDDQMFCIGWLVNQLGPGNNIGLRMAMMNYSNAKDIKVKGRQHDRFEDTLPK